MGKKLGQWTSETTMWKSAAFSVIQILREIKFGEFERFENEVFAILEDLNLVKLVNTSLQKGQKFIKIKIQSLSSNVLK